MQRQYLLFVSVTDGLYCSADAGQSWSPWGPRGIKARRLLATPDGDLYATGKMPSVRGSDKEPLRGLFVLRRGEKRWRETSLVSRFQGRTGLRHTATGPMALLAVNGLLVGTGCGVWLVARGGATCVPIGPGVVEESTWRGEERSFVGSPLVDGLVISRSRYGEVDAPLILAADYKQMRWCRWGDGARGLLQNWHDPYASPNDYVMELIEWGDSVAACTRYGVFVNGDARGPGWRPIEAPGVRSPLLSAAMSPDRSASFFVNGGEMAMCDRDPAFESKLLCTWRTVWTDAMASPWAHSGEGGATAPPVFSPYYRQDRTAFALSSKAGFIRSTDDGLTWRQSNLGLDDYPAGLTMAVMPL